MLKPHRLELENVKNKFAFGWPGVGRLRGWQEESTAIDGNEKLAYESPVIDAKKFYFEDHFDDVEASR
ncbi:GD24694 [Drosophila simulans]|uniref:GD24694 n=1 Tax=Drosophila simulans TaxID=7240 RepID=B4NTQ7_DROSI|nr:GD24694 [Drosophila simulans]